MPDSSPRGSHTSDDRESARCGGADAIVARDLTKRFGGVEAVRGVSFSVPDRCVCGLLGPNGAGKTTTIRMVAGLLAPDRGSLTIADHDMATDADAARGEIGYLPESAPVHPELRTREFLAYRAALRGLRGAAATAEIDRCVAACEIGSVAGRLVGALSKGFRQRVGVAAAMLGAPRILILDEPSVGLDPHQLLHFRRLLRDLARRHTVLLSSHILAEIEASCDRAILVSHGSIVAQGTLDELRRQGCDEYTVEARGQGVQAALTGVVGLGDLRTVDLGDGWRRVTARGAIGGGDVREEIAAALSRSGYVVRELRRDRASLESLFVAATRNGVNSEAGAAA